MLAISIDKSSPLSLYQQVYEELRLLILSGRLKSGQKLPSSRELAKHLCISRTISSLGYKMLESEGYISTVPAVGTFVSAEIPDVSLRAAANSHEMDWPIAAPVSCIKISKLANTINEHSSLSFLPVEGLIKLGTNSPSVDDFPLDLWRQITNRVLKEAYGECLGYTPLEGCKPLKSALLNYLNISRAVKCSEDQIIICAGSRQALDLVARAHVDEADLVAIEDPAYGGARQAFQSAQLLGIPLDGSGLQTSKLASLPENVNLIYVTPSHQYPLGSTMALQRRLELLHWANRSGAMIIEDDYDSEFRYGERPIPSLQGLDTANRVVYIGTFSKTIFPALRIGYIVAPPSVAPLYRQMQQSLYGQIPYLEQMVLAQFLAEGHFDRHVRRMRTIYERRRNLARIEFSRVHRKAEIIGDNAGMAFVLRLPEIAATAGAPAARRLRKSDLDTLLKRMSLAGIQMRSTNEFYLNEQMQGIELIIGYGGLSEEQIKYCARTLKRVISEL